MNNVKTNARPDIPDDNFRERYKDSKLYVIPVKFQRKRLDDMKKSMKKKGIHFCDTLSPDVTHIVSECDSHEQVERHLTQNSETIPDSASVVSTQWLIDCLKASSVLPVKECHLLKKKMKDSEIKDTQHDSHASTAFPEWSCQRGATLEHLNLKLTSAIETLQEFAELRDDNHDYSRALAFRRASSVLKALPFCVQRLDQLKGLKDIGEHVKEVITDILDHGSSQEVDRITNSEWYKKMKLFTSVFGVGPSTAKTWIDNGWETIEDVQRTGCPSADWRVAWGLAFLHDLNTPVAKCEADNFKAVVQDEAEKILPGIIVMLVGGFRRGKLHGHDVDILLSHPIEGREKGVLPQLLSVLTKKGYILVGHKENSTFRSDVLFQDFKLSARGQLDHFEKWLGISKFPKSFSEISKDSLSCSEQDTKQLQDNHNNDISTKQRLLKNLSDENTNASFSKSQHDSQNYLDDSYEPKVKRAKNAETVDGEANRLAKAPRDWVARRVDFIIAPYSQYFYALVGWTGSKHFNRDARLYAQKKLGLKLTSHGLYDTNMHEIIPAHSEEEVFAQLKLPFLDPTKRNC